MKILALLLAILPLTIGDVFTIRTLEKINSEDSPILRVCFDGHLTTDLNSSEFKLQISNNFTQTVFPSVSAVSEQCQMFKVNLEHYSGPTSFLLTLQSRLARKSASLAHGSVTVTLKNINFTGVWVGNLRKRQDGLSVRIQHDYKAGKREKLKASLVGLDTEKVFNCKSSPCYLLDVDGDLRYHEVQLCLSNVASTDTKGCQVCEWKAPENSKEQFILDLPEPDSIVLTYGKDGKPYISVVGPFDDTTVSLEIVLYRGGGKTYHLISAECNASSKGGSKLCRSPNIVRLSGQGQYKVLLVALGQDGKVTHSSAASFENFATKVVQLSSDLIEVQWKAAEGGVYEVSLNQDVPGGYNNVTVRCGGMNSSSCSVYFTKLDQKTYEVQVKKNDSAHNAVARVTTLQEEIREHLRVFSVLHGISNTPDDRTNLTVCIEETIDSHSYDLILIDRWGTTLRTRSHLKGSHILCFPPVVIDSSFDASREVRVLVKAETLLRSFYGDSELFLLGLSPSDDNKMLTVDQVGKRTVRVKWLNLNDGQVAIGNVFSLTEDAIVRSVNRISCQYRGECGKYVHFVGKTVSFQITEMAEDLQIIHAQMHFADIFPIKIISSTIDWSGRVKVCFHEVKEAYRYELGLELDHSTLIDDTRYPETISSGDRQLCLLSQSQIDAGPDSVVTVIVSGLDRRGTLLAAGNDLMKVNFFSSTRTVLAASAMDGLIASWGHMVPLRNNEEYHVSFKPLGSPKEQQTDVMVAEKQLFHRFAEEGRDDFAICVRPREKLPKAVNGEACSDIIHSSNVSALPAIPVEEMKLRTASAESILVTWKPPKKEDVSSYIVSWNLEYFSEDDELPAADKLLYILPPSLVSAEFKILPAEQITWTLHNLKENSRYQVCVAAVERGVMGHKTCGLVDLDAYYQLSYPLDVKYKKGVVKWDGEMNCTCHVEWKSLTEGTSNYAEVEGNSYKLDLGPGVWEITVRNVTGGVASGPSKIRVSVEGIVISTKQTGQASLTITWSENKDIPSTKASNTTFAYEVTFSGGGKPLGSPTVKRCSGRMEDCSVQFTDKLISPNDEISVNVLSLNSSNSARVFHRIRAIEKIKSLSAKMGESDSAEVTWDKVYEATRYNYILYNNQKRERIRLSGTQQENHLQISISELEGCIFAVQVCIGGNACGDFSTVTLTGTNERSIIYSFEVAIAGAAFFILLIAFAFRKKSSSGQTGRDGQQTRADAGRIRKSV